jgi:RimJ/RimL family protein N-acetyltransferase
MKVIETEHLILRYLTVKDSEFMLELLNDPAWLQFIGDRGVRTVDDARNYILHSLVTMYDRLGFGMYLIELKNEGVSIGICGLIKRDYLEDVDIGFTLLSKFRGKGYAYESAAAVMAYGKRTFALNRLVAIASPDNYDSIELLKKLGFIFERTIELSNDGKNVNLFATDL